MAQVGYDVAKIGYGKLKDDPELVEEGVIDLVSDGAALVTPYVPAGASKVKRLVGKGDDVVRVDKSLDRPDSLDSIEKTDVEFVDSSKINNESEARYRESNPDGVYQQSWQSDTKVVDFKTSRDVDDQFVRVYTRTENNKTKKEGNWILNKKDIEGLSPEQIQQKYSLPNKPTHIVDVSIPSGTPMRSGEAAPAFGGSGGGRQYEIMTDTKSQWFNNSKLLNKK